MRRRILIVEDEAVTSVMLERTLKELGYEVVGSAFDGAEAINLAREKRPDIVLMDIRIQGDIDGIETAKRIYQQFKIPIIYLTAHSDDDTIRRAVESGPFGYLIKPFKERELYSNIEMVAHKHKLYQTTTQSQPVPEPEPQKESVPQIKTPPTAFKPGDYRLGILAIQSIPHPVILFNSAGDVVFTNNACKNFFKQNLQKKEIPNSISDLPELFGKVWNSGRDRFSEGKGYAINGTISVRSSIKKVRIDMVPLMERGVLQFISSILMPEPASGIGGGFASSGSHSLFEEVESRLKEIQYLASPEETHRMRQISLISTEILKKIRSLKDSMYQGTEKER